MHPADDQEHIEYCSNLNKPGKSVICLSHLLTEPLMFDILLAKWWNTEMKHTIHSIINAKSAFWISLHSAIKQIAAVLIFQRFCECNYFFGWRSIPSRKIWISQKSRLSWDDDNGRNRGIETNRGAGHDSTAWPAINDSCTNESKLCEPCVNFDVLFLDFLGQPCNVNI